MNDHKSRLVKKLAPQIVSIKRRIEKGAQNRCLNMLDKLDW